MKKYMIGVFIFLFVAAFSSAYEAFAQETYDFDGTIQIKVGKKKIKEHVAGTVDVTMTEEEEEFAKKDKVKLSDSNSSTFEEATFYFEFGAEDTDCGETLDEESIEVDSNPQENGGGGGGSKRNVRIEFDQNSMTDVIARILEKNGETVQEVLDLDDCFSTTGGTGEQTVEFWVNHVSGTAYIKSTYIKISFSGNSEIQISDQNYQNQKRYKQRISGKLKIPLE